MSWVKMDDVASENMKLREAGTDAFALWTAGLGFCNRHLTDGRIEHRLLADVWRPVDGRRFDYKAAATRLLEGRLWHHAHEPCDSKLCPNNPELASRIQQVPNAYGVHDYFEYQKSRAEILAARESGTNRVRRHRERRLSDAVTDSVGNAVTDGVTDSVTGGVSNSVSNDRAFGGNARETKSSDFGRKESGFDDSDSENETQDITSASGLRNAVTSGVSNALPDPSPVPVERDSEPPLALHEVERLCFNRFGALAGANAARIKALKPRRHELLDALKTKAESWGYAAKVIASARKAALEAAPPAYTDPRQRPAGRGWNPIEYSRDEEDTGT
jgi:hypothetical protein